MIKANDVKTACLLDIEHTFECLGVEEIKKAGNGQFMGLCPFHDDNNPSFSFNSEGLWKCFAGCGSGDVFDAYANYYFISRKNEFPKLLKIINEVVGAK